MAALYVGGFDPLCASKAWFDPLLAPDGVYDDIIIKLEGATAPDVYAWFPGDPGPAPPGMRRYEEYAKEELPQKPKRRRHRHPLRVPRPLQPIAFPEPFTPDPVVIPPPAPPLELPFQPVPTPAQPEPIEAQLPAPPEPTGAHWTEYAHLPYSAEQENEELQAILAAVLARGR